MKLQKLDERGYGLIGGIISLIFGLIVALLAFRLLFRLLGANANNDIVSWIYSTSQPLVQPFFGIFNTNIDVSTGHFEVETLIALIVYGVIGSLLASLFGRTRTVV